MKDKTTNLLILVSSILIALILVEFYLRFFVNEEGGRLRIVDPLLHHALRPNIATFSKWGDTRPHYFINSLGFRDKKVRKIDPHPDYKRILFLGDSFTEGVGVEYSDTFVSKFEFLVDKGASHHIEAINCGISSYSPLLEFLLLKDLIRKKIKFDMVALMVDVSDAQDQVLYDEWFKGKDTITLFRFHLWYPYNNSAIFRLTWNSLSDFKQSITIQRKYNKVALNSPRGKEYTLRIDDRGLPVDNQAYYAERAAFTENEEIYKRWGKKGISLIERDIAKIKTLLEQQGIPFVVVIYPWKTQLKSKIKPSIYETSLVGYSKSNGINLINLFTDFEGYGDYEFLYNREDNHWNSKGHAFVAERLYQHMKEKGFFAPLFKK